MNLKLSVVVRTVIAGLSCSANGLLRQAWTMTSVSSIRRLRPFILVLLSCIAGGIAVAAVHGHNGYPYPDRGTLARVVPFVLAVEAKFVAFVLAVDWNSCIAQAATVFLVLYAAFGISEVKRHLPAAWAFAVRLWKQHHYIKALFEGSLGVIVACGPLYIAVEVIIRVLGAASVAV
jgi:hypothetical protein